MFYFYIHLKCQKSFGFAMFSGGIETETWAKMSLNISKVYILAPEEFH